MVSLYMPLWLQFTFLITVKSNNLDVGDIRLAGGSGPFEGRVEIQVAGVWGTVCDYLFYTQEATVMCRMLGLQSTSYFSGAHFEQGIGPIFAQKFDCNGSESHLRDCTFNANTFCSHSRDVGIICSECGNISISNGRVHSISADGKTLTISCYEGFEITKNTTICRNGSWSAPSFTCTPIGFTLNISDIRIVNGTGVSDGTVELLVNGTWGTVCARGYSTNEGRVLCRMLGFPDVYDTSYVYSNGTGSGFIHLTNLYCTGTELHINNCTYKIEHSCDFHGDAAVICEYPFNASDIRLVDGTGLYDGRVEIFVNGTWGTVCSKYYSSYIASDAMETLCRMLSYNLTMSFTTAVYGQGSGPIFTGYIGCVGPKESINNCTTYPPRSYCSHTYDLSLVCTPCGQPDILYGYLDSVNDTVFTAKCYDSYIPEEYKLHCLENGTWIHEDACSSKYAYPLDIVDIRLVSNYRPSEGRVELLVDGEWGTICDNNLTATSAAVLCHMTGLKLQKFYTDARGYGEGQGRIYVDYLICNGSELHINNCSYNVENTCTHTEDVSVICTGYQLNITDIRLAGTTGPYHGRIELEVNGTWGTIGGDRFLSNEANAVCRMLGLQYKQVLYDAAYGQGSGPIYVDRLGCSSSDTHINQCRYSVDNYYNTKHDEDVSVICWGPTLKITAGRLANGTGPFDGRAEIKVGDTWGTICDENFNIRDADLFCRLLGLRAARFFTGALYGEGSGPIFIDQLFCDDNDVDLSSCQYLFLNECKHDQDVSVVCNECGQPDISYTDAGYFTYNGTTLYADCTYYKTYIGTLELTCDNITQTWIKNAECQEYSYPLNVTDIRLTDGPTKTNGRVEIKSLDVWGTLCDDNFGMAEADVICNMIGHPPAVAFFPGAHYGEGTGPIFVDDISCSDDATYISNCTYNTYDNCHHIDDISVNCTDCGDPKPENGYVNSSATNYGAVIEVTCNRDFKLVGEKVITCQLTGAWNDEPKCHLIAEHECSTEAKDNCMDHSICYVIEGTANCICLNGYQNVNGGCEDVNECNTDTSCPDNSICENRNGNFTCKCKKGYFKTGGETCDECDYRHYGNNCFNKCNCNFEHTDDCHHETGVCICSQGWKGENCSIDVNECTDIPNVCEEKSNSTCTNKVGFFLCECNTGFLETNGTCTDIDECSTSPCSHTCENVPGSFKCSCNEGYSLSNDSVTCQECDYRHYGNNCFNTCPCNLEHTDDCHHETGQCICKQGWIGDNCSVDINECIDTPNICKEKQNSTCINNIGSFLCECNTGFLESNGTCTACMNGLYGSQCSEKCQCEKENTESCHYVTGNCTCNEGWNGTLCFKDINECESSVNVCLNKANSTCENTNGSYICACNDGFREQGDLCTDCGLWRYGQDCISECTCNRTKSTYCHPSTGECTCETGWNGTTCEDDIAECNIENVCQEHSTCINFLGSFDCKCDLGFVETEIGTCDECTGNTYGQNCSNQCRCHVTNSANEHQTCDAVTGQCKCKAGWEGEMCTDDVNECERHSAVCVNDEDHKTCVNTEGGYVCDCIRGFTETLNGNCVEDIGISTETPAGEIRFDLRVTIDISLPGGTNINASSIFESLRRKCESSLLGFLRRFTAASVHITATDIMIDSQVLVDYTIVQKTKVATFASKLTQAVLELQHGSFFNFDGRNVSAFSDSYKGLEPCQVYKETIGLCDDGYTCEVENGIPDCKKREGTISEVTCAFTDKQINWAMVIGLCAAGLFLVIATVILLVAVWHLKIKRHRKKQSGRNMSYALPITKKDDQASLDFDKIGRSQRGEEVNVGMRFPPWSSMSSREERPFPSGDDRAQPYHSQRAPTNTRRSDREYSLY